MHNINILNHSNFYCERTPPAKTRSIPPFLQKARKKTEKIWSYAGRVLLLTRHVLNATAKSCQHFTLTCGDSNRKILAVITRLKLFSIVGITFNCLSIPSMAQQIIKNVHLKDKEGVALSTLSLTMIATDIVDSIGTFVNAVLMIADKAAVGFFSVLAMPLSFSLIGMGSISRIVQVAKTQSLYRSIKKVQPAHQNADPLANIYALKDFIEKKLGVTPEELSLIISTAKSKGNFSANRIEEIQKEELFKLKEKKKSSFLRAAPQEALQEMEKIFEKIKDVKTIDQKQIDDINLHLSKIYSSLKRKRNLEIGHLMSNLLNLIALTMFFTAAPTFVPFIFLAASLILKVSLLAYDDLAKKS